jgi:HEPN domain-containing protein
MHDDADYLAQARRWLRYAVEDLDEAETLVGWPHSAPRHACFFAQQAVEKAIKAVLVFLHIDFPRVHDLDALRALVPQDWPFRDEHPRLGGLTEWAIEARYPGNWTDATPEDAEEAVRQARAVWNSIERDLMAHGLEVTPAEAPAPDGEQ